MPASPVSKLVADIKRVVHESSTSKSWASKVAAKLEMLRELDEELWSLPHPITVNMARIFHGIVTGVDANMVARLRAVWEPAVRHALEVEDEGSDRDALQVMIGDKVAGLAAKVTEVSGEVVERHPKPRSVVVAPTEEIEGEGTTCLGSSRESMESSLNRKSTSASVDVDTVSTISVKKRAHEEEEVANVKKAKTGKGKARAVNSDTESDNDDKDEGSERDSGKRSEGGAAVRSQKGRDPRTWLQVAVPQPDDLCFFETHRCSRCKEGRKQECRVPKDERRSRCRYCIYQRQACSGPDAVEMPAAKQVATHTASRRGRGGAWTAAPKSKAVVTDTDSESDSLALAVLKPKLRRVNRGGESEEEVAKEQPAPSVSRARAPPAVTSILPRGLFQDPAPLLGTPDAYQAHFEQAVRGMTEAFEAALAAAPPTPILVAPSTLIFDGAGNLGIRARVPQDVAELEAFAESARLARQRRLAELRFATSQAMYAQRIVREVELQLARLKAASPDSRHETPERLATSVPLVRFS